MGTSTDISINERLKQFLDGLEDSYTVISKKTGIPRRTLYGIVEKDATIKHNYIEALCEKYHLNLNWLFGHADNSTNINDEQNKDLGTPRPSADPQLKESLTEHQFQRLTDFERRIEDLVHRIEHGPWSAAAKISIIDSLLNIIEQDLQGSLQEKPHSQDDS